MTGTEQNEKKLFIARFANCRNYNGLTFSKFALLLRVN